MDNHSAIMMASVRGQLISVFKIFEEWRSLENNSLELNGHSLSISKLVAVADKRISTIIIPESLGNLMSENSKYLMEKLASGTVIYGINTGYGGSANVRCHDLLELQRALIRHLNVGFGRTLEPEIVRALMAVRVNSLVRGYSGVRPEVVNLLCQMVNADIVPVVPLRGTISASGDLCPLSYIASCMSGREDARVTYKGNEVLASEAFAAEHLTTIEFQAKEALALVNAASVASTYAAKVLFDSTIAVLLTQLVTAMSVECLRGRTESFHPTVIEGLPHLGNQEVARILLKLVQGSKLARHGLEGDKKDDPTSLKQDRYPIRTAPQWLGPTVEILLESIRRVTVELNSVGDNPIIDHRTDEVIHNGNFQGISTTVAMDQIRQALQMCGRLVFAQLSEILNYTMNDGLPPNLSGCDPSSDFGFKGVDTATASYMSELDFLNGPLTNHVHSAEMHNQAVNSMALVSARMSGSALELVQMILTNALCAQCQAIDLRWLEIQVLTAYDDLMTKTNFPTAKLAADFFKPLFWYQMAFNPVQSAEQLEDLFVKTCGIPANGILIKFVDRMKDLTNRMKTGNHVTEVSECLGKGTKEVYLYVRRTLKIGFNYGAGSAPIDKSLEKIFAAIQSREIVDVIISTFQKEKE